MKIKVLCFYAPFIPKNYGVPRGVFEAHIKDKYNVVLDSVVNNVEKQSIKDGSDERLTSTKSFDEYKLVKPIIYIANEQDDPFSIIQDDLGKKFKQKNLKAPTEQELGAEPGSPFWYLYLVGQKNALENPYASIELDLFYTHDEDWEVQGMLPELKKKLPFNVTVNFVRISPEMDGSPIYIVKGQGYIDPNYELTAQGSIDDGIENILGGLDEDKQEFLNSQSKLSERAQGTPFQTISDTMADMAKIQILSETPEAVNLMMSARDLLDIALCVEYNELFVDHITQLLESTVYLIKNLDEKNPDNVLHPLEPTQRKIISRDTLVLAQLMLNAFNKFVEKLDDQTANDLQTAINRLARSHYGKKLAGGALKAAGMISITLPVFAFIALPLLISPTFTLPLALIAAGLYMAFTVASVFAGALINHVGNNKVIQADTEQKVKQKIIDNTNTLFTNINSRRPHPTTAKNNDTDSEIITESEHTPFAPQTSTSY